MSYDHKRIESKWQDNWDRDQTFKSEIDWQKPKYYALDMFPYPSGSGLHVGHPEGYTATDIVSRYKRSKGFNVLHPMGWDAFGLPAEQHALATGVHPVITTKQSIDNFRRQLKMLGFSYDWSREISTCDPSYYKWTQWIFLRLYEKGLAYQKEVPVNWCAELKTVLANEEVVDGKSERGGHQVIRVAMKQWMLRITNYAERLLTDLDKLNWPEGTKELQRNWIGKSSGLKLSFDVGGFREKIDIFTTRPDTIYGVTYLVLAPEHPMVIRFTSNGQRQAVEEYRRLSARKSDLARQDAKNKTGVFIGAYAIHLITGEPLPVWISDYVLMGYGTGAVMAVPAHDERDFEFAKQFDLEIKTVIDGGQGQGECYVGEGININSGIIDGKKTAEAKEIIIDWAEEKNAGMRTTQYKLRDWLFSRQRYWGEPFPIVTDHMGKLRPIESNELPVSLPEVQSYEPSGTGESPLAVINDWVNTTYKQQPAMRETDTMPGSAGSSWYFLRYCDPHNDKEPFSQEAVKYWMPVDIYLGGPEHAVGHLLYARFWTKVLFDAQIIPFDEPFAKLVHQGMILGEDGEKMSKSRGNVINPDDIVAEYGADTLRIYEMFMGPLDRDKPWNTSAIEGSHRFLSRAWRLFVNEDLKVLLTDEPPTNEDLQMLHKTVKKVTVDIENLAFNTAISQMMVFVNHFTKTGKSPRVCLKPFIQLLNPFSPHIAEELWEAIGQTSVLTYEIWPEFDPSLAQDDLITIAVQVLGKTRGTLEVQPDITQAEIESLAKALSSVSNQLTGHKIKKIIYVPRKIINFVIA